MSSSLTVTAKGQVTLKKEFLQHLGIEPGAKLIVEKRPDGGLTLHAARLKTGTIDDVFGMLKRPGQPTLSIEEINDVIATGWAGALEID